MSGSGKSIGQRLVGCGVWATEASLYATSLAAVGVLQKLRRPKRRREKGLRLIVTGRFDSLNWCRAHLLPLAEAECLERIVAVVDGPTYEHEKITYRHPPAWLTRLLGRAASKAIWVAGLAARTRPDIIMGFHIVPGALTVLLVSSAIGARSVYQMTAGPVELIGGGIGTECPLSGRLAWPSPLLERLALRLVHHFDAVVVRGTGARDFLLNRRSVRAVAIIPGSIDASRFAGDRERVYDLAYVGRLEPIKQPLQFLHVVAALCRRRPNVRAAVVGGGALDRAMRDEAARLGLDGTVEFLGHVQEVEDVLRRTKVFVLTSRSEGLSIAMAEAMAAGAVPVVADVGDLGDLVQDGRTGYLVPPGDFEAYATRCDRVLSDPDLRQRCSEAARIAAAENNAIMNVTRRWQQCLTAAVRSPTAKPSPKGPLGPPADEIAHGSTASRLYQWWLKAVPPACKRLAAKPLTLVPPRCLLGSQFSRQTYFIEHSERWTDSRIRRYQLHRLRQVLQLAGETTPFYQEMFRQVRFDPRSLADPDELRRLPTIDRQTIRRHLPRMCTINPRSDGVDMVSTGGTSGMPLHFYINSDRSSVEYAFLVASWRRAGYRLGMPLAVLRGHVVRPDADGLHHEYEPILRHHYYSSFHLSDENIGRYLDHIAGLGPCFLHVYPSSVLALARHILRCGRSAPDNIRGIIAESEIVYPDQRRMVEEVFGCRYFSCYGHTEKLVLAAECEHTGDYHVWPTYGYFELLDGAGRTVATPGQRGEIVATGFINQVVPFVRYRSGDTAEYVADRCPRCGRYGPILRDIRGHRTQEVLIAADGSAIAWTALNMHDETFLHVRRFQFVQDTPGRARLRLVPAGGFREEDIHRIRRNLQRKLDGRLDLDMEICDSIGVSPQGKAIYVDQRIAGRAAAGESAASSEREPWAGTT